MKLFSKWTMVLTFVLGIASFFNSASADDHLPPPPAMPSGFSLGAGFTADAFGAGLAGFAGDAGAAWTEKSGFAGGAVDITASGGLCGDFCNADGGVNLNAAAGEVVTGGAWANSGTSGVAAEVMNMMTAGGSVTVTVMPGQPGEPQY